MVKFDPRVKLFIIIALLVIIFVKTNLLFQSIILLLFVLFLILSKYLNRVIDSVRLFLVFIPLTLTIHVIFTSLNFSIGGVRFTFSYEGLLVSIMFTIRLLNLFLVSGFAFNWINGIELIDSVYSILCPLKKLKFPVDDLFMIIFIGIRFFPIVKREVKDIDQSYRNFFNVDRNSTVIGRIKEFKNILSPLMVYILKKADTLSLSMYIRGYGEGKRTYYKRLKFVLKDWILFLLITSFAITIIYV